MSGTATARAAPAPRAPAPVIQRRCACGAKRADECQECKARRVQRRPANGAAARGTTVPPIVESVLRSAGSPLETRTRTWFETRFHRDFSNVRIHTDERAAESARVLNAVAYTSGANIVFGAGQYSTQSEHGRRLLAHELTHVVQQRARALPGGVSDSNDAAEREAERNADHVASGPLTFEARPHLLSRQTAAENAPPPGACTPERRQRIGPAQTTSRAWLRTAVAALDAYIADPDSPATAATRASLVKHFHSPAVGVATHVRTNIQSILDDVEQLIEADQPAEDFRRLPAHTTECRPAGDPECESLAAFVFGSRMVFCEPFFTHPLDRYRAGVLIHEVAHTLGGLDIEDRAYDSDRLLEFLTPAEAVNNADSYAMFVEEVGTGRAVTGKPPRDEIEDCAPDVKRQIREALGRAQRWNEDAEEEAADERAVAIRINKPIFTTHVGNGEAGTRAAAARLFRRMSSTFSSAIDVVCDAQSGASCSATHRAYGKKARNNVGLGAALGAGIGGVLGLGAGLGAGFGLATSMSVGAAAGIGLAVGFGIALLGTIVGLIAGALTSSGASVHVCPDRPALPPLSRAESILAAVYEAFADLTPEQSRKHAALAHALHDSGVGPPPAI